MKKFFFITGAFVFISLLATAQSAQLGIKAGVNASSIKVSGSTDFESKAGFYAGGLAHVHITPHFAVQPELVFSMEGGKNGNLIRRQNYIDLPVLAQYMTNTGFRLQTGPQLGFLVSAKNKMGNVEVDVKDGMKAADLSWSFGASYLSKMGLGVDARYNLGITNVNESESPEARNMVFQVGAFYQFAH